jgi:hypothetical protein
MRPEYADRRTVADALAAAQSVRAAAHAVRPQRRRTRPREKDLQRRRSGNGAAAPEPDGSAPPANVREKGDRITEVDLRRCGRRRGRDVRGLETGEALAEAVGAEAGEALVRV